MKLKIVLAVMIAVLLIALVAIEASGEGEVDHCPAGWITKYESPFTGISVLGDTVTFLENTTFCVKWSTVNSGVITGTTYTTIDGKDISYVVIYDPSGTATPTPTEVVTETPTETPEVTPTPVPTLPIPPECVDCKIAPETGKGNFWHDLFYFLFGWLQG